MRFSIIARCLTFVCLAWPWSAEGFGIADATGNGLEGGSRWDANPRTMNGLERSLAGGLRFSLQGGSYAAYRDLLHWAGTPPTAEEIEQAVLDAFAVWTRVDPATGLGTTLQFVPDLGTVAGAAVVDDIRMGSEIDILASTNGVLWNPGNPGTQAETFYYSISVEGDLRLTSGTTGYAGYAITGSDITFNNNPGALYTLTDFRTILAHEIGHAIGLKDVDVVSGPAGTFIDDNYAAATPRATLTNSFALKINHLNPGASPLALYTVANGNPGIDTRGVNILMESFIPDVFFGPALGMANDDFAGRQFLYPVAPPEAPVLTSRWEGNELVLTWNEVPAWVLESSGILDAEGWSDFANQGSPVAGVREVRVQSMPARMFFRLRRTQ